MFLLAATTADDVFKSMGDTLDADVNPWHIAGVVLVVIVVVALIALLNRRSGPRRAKPKANNNMAKLTRQLARASGLKSRELKQLKLLAEQQDVTNPLVLLLCPSVLKAAVANRQTAKA